MADIYAAVSALAAVIAACFAGAAWITSRNTFKYTKATEAPHLVITRDVFIYGIYEIAHLAGGKTPYGVPPETVVLKRFPVKMTGETSIDNKPCLIFNSSIHDSSSPLIHNYSGLFGEVYLENKGKTNVIQIEVLGCTFKMRSNNKYGLEDFDLKGVGTLNVDIARESPFTFYVGYICDNDHHMICNPEYMIDGKLNNDAIKMKKLKSDQLNCPLPIIIDLYEELVLKIKYTAIDGTLYIQQHTIEIQLENEGGTYFSRAGRATVMRSKYKV